MAITDDDPAFRPPQGWRRNYWDPLYGDPWMGAEAREAHRARRLHRWRASLTPRDRERIRALADQVAPHFSPARLDDLDARGLAVGCCHKSQEWRMSGERLGLLRDGEVVVLAWPK